MVKLSWERGGGACELGGLTWAGLAGTEERRERGDCCIGRAEAEEFRRCEEPTGVGVCEFNECCWDAEMLDEGGLFN